MKKDFDSWNTEKKKTNSKRLDFNFFYHNREVWWCAVGINVGVETDGKNKNFERPVLVVRKFNKDMFLGVPFTKTERVGDFYQKIKITEQGDESWALLSQVKNLSAKRLLRKIGRISEDEFSLIQTKLKNLFI